MKKTDLVGCWARTSEHEFKRTDGTTRKTKSSFKFCLDRRGRGDIIVFEPTGEGASLDGKWRLSRGKVKFSDDWSGEQECTIVSVSKEKLVLADCVRQGEWSTACSGNLEPESYEAQYCSPKAAPKN